MSIRETKLCRACGRSFEYRTKWKKTWDSIKYCSDRCRRNKLTDEDLQLEQVILEFLSKRASGATICPSEVARTVFDAANWRENMEDVRCAARRLVNQGKVVITQRGKPVDPSTARGPIRIRRA